MKSIERRFFHFLPRFSTFLALAVLQVAALAAACSSASTNIVAPTAQKCQISVSEFTRTFGAAGGSGTAAVSAERECSWTAATQTPWITVATAQGTGSGTLTYTVAPNQAAQGRSGALAVNNEQLTVSQEPAPCRFTVSPTTLQVDAAGGTFPVGVSTLSGCSWGAATGASWIRVDAASGSGSGGVSITVTPNTGPERSDTLSVAGQPVTVIQAAAIPGPAPDPPTPGCSFALTPASLTFPPEGGQATVRVETQGRCAWTAATTATWLAITPAIGDGPASVTVVASANATGALRSGSISLGGQTVVALQDAAAASPAPEPVRISGTVSRKGGDCPSITFTVNGVSVVTTAETAFVADRCDRVRNGAEVIVEGLQQPGQPVVATRVIVTDD